MIAAYNISNHGRDFTPWTTYTSGKYRSFIGQATTAASSSPSTGGPINTTQTAFGLPSPSQIGSKVEEIGLVLLAVGLAATLVVVGGYRLAGSPKLPKSAALAAL